MADNKTSEKKPGEKPEGKYHYNPGNQSGKMAKKVTTEEVEKANQPSHDSPTPRRSPK